MLQRLHEQLMLVAKGLVEAPFVQARAIAQIRERGRLVAFLPKSVHSGVEYYLFVEFAGSPYGPM
jgi:hypothetical protein